jgi:hypothetical protein
MNHSDDCKWKKGVEEKRKRKDDDAEDKKEPFSDLKIAEEVWQDTKHKAPEIPAEREKHFSYDSKSKVLLGKFVGTEPIEEDDRKFILQNYDNPSISVVTEGILPAMSESGIEDMLKSMCRSLKNTGQFKVKQYERQKDKNGKTSRFTETKHSLAINSQHFLKFLEASWKGEIGEHKIKDLHPVFQTGKSIVHKLSTQDSKLYLYDVDMPKTLIPYSNWYQEQFKLQEVMPRGSYCLLSSVSYSFQGGTWVSFTICVILLVLSQSRLYLAFFIPTMRLIHSYRRTRLEA